MRPLALLALALVSCLAAPPAAALAGGPAVPAIVHAEGAEPAVVLAAREIQRYLYARSGVLAPITTRRPAAGEAIVLAIDGTLGEESFALTTSGDGESRVLEIRAGGPTGALYGAYRFAERLGVRFALHGDILPDEPLAWDGLPDLEEEHSPLFPLRGVQPFHDFPEGPDWWDRDDYRAHLSQLAKLRMNFLGLHCYPEGHAGPEPLVWIGLPRDVDEAGRVSHSYPSRWASTLGGAWGYAPVPTSEFAAGAALAFEDEVYGPEVTEGHRPMPRTPEGANEVFNRAGALFAEVVHAAHERGVRVCVGTETPLTIPSALRERLESLGLDPADPATVRMLYEGLFTRLERLAPVDYYWLWTPEGWTWSGTTREQVEATLADLAVAHEALERVGRPFPLATCGWVLGPPSDPTLFDRVLPRDMPVSCINRDVGFDPVDPAFAMVGGRGRWAIPWMEDDPAMIVPQLWAGRMRRDAADALAYGCDGIMGIHWRTRVLAPNVSALAAAAWNQSGWGDGAAAPPPKPALLDVHIGGAAADYPANEIAGAGLDRMYQTCRWGLEGYRLDLPPGRYDLTLQFCEVHYREPGKRVFGVRVQDEQVVEGLDVFARVGANAPLDLRFTEVEVDGEPLRIDFTREIEHPFIAGIVVTPAAAPLRRINCGGGAAHGYEPDLPALGSYPALLDRPRDLPVADFYDDWARAHFGPGAGPALAALFTRLDGSPPQWRGRASNLPRPSDWDHGPGGIKINRTPWARERERYAFVDEMGRLRPLVRGPGNLDRFDYWLNTFGHLRLVGEIGCARGALDAAMERVAGAPEAQRRELAAAEALPLRLELARLWERMMTAVLATLSTPGELGTIANLEQHVRRDREFLSLHDETLESLLGPLPPEARPTSEYVGDPRIAVPTVRADVGESETLSLRIIVLDAAPVSGVEVRWRRLGAGRFEAKTAEHLGRGVWRADLPAPGAESFEYFVEASDAEGRTLRWPAGAPERTQTVVAAPPA